MGDAKSNEKATLSRSSGFVGLKCPIEKVIFALLTRTINLFIDEGPIELHAPHTGRALLGSGDGPTIKVTLYRIAALGKMLRRPDLCIGECFMEREWDVADEDLARLLILLLRNDARLEDRLPVRLLNAIRQSIESIIRPNNSERSRQNASHHYDIGNDLYESFLDTEMLYSCAFYSHEGESLEEAQINKIAVTLERLNVAPGMTVLDIGCGWGAMTRAIADADANAIGITLAEQQLALATKRIPLHHVGSIEYILEDYRVHASKNADTYDRVVSIGMFEHVGRRQFKTYFKAIQALLKPGGRAVVHSIIKDSATPTNAWVDKYIFPGGYIPQIEDMTESAYAAGLTVLCDPYIHASNNYAQTLRHWRERFNTRSHELDHTKYDERFRRMWKFYLAGSEAAFDGLGFHIAQIVVVNASSATSQSRPRRHLPPAQPIRRMKTERNDLRGRDQNPHRV